MLPLINQALMSGYSATQILKFVGSKFPNFKPGIDRALSAGFVSENILKFLSQKIPHSKNGAEKQANANDQYLSSIGIKTKEEREAARSRSLSGLVGIGAGALASFALSHALPKNVSDLMGGSESKENAPSLLGRQQGIGTQAQDAVQQSPSAPIATQSGPVTQPVNVQRNPQRSIEVIKSSGQEASVKNMLEKGMKPKDIAGVVKQFIPKSQQKALEQTEGGLESLITDYAETTQGESQKLAQMEPKSAQLDAGVTQAEGPGQEKQDISAIGGMAKGMMDNFYEGVFKSLKEGKDTFSGVKEPLIQHAKSAFEAGQIKSPEDLKNFAQGMQKENKPIEKKSLVSSPQGIGEVREIRNGKALVEVDGKLHKIDSDELEQSPLPEKELADLYDELVGGIEKETGQEVSRNVEWAGYDPKTNELLYKPHGSNKVYAYADIPEEAAETLTSFLTQRKSTGENFIGAWKKGSSSPIGAAMYQLIKKLQDERGGKGNEYKNRFETLYDALEPAKEAAKKRHAERKKEAKKPRIT